MHLIKEVIFISHFSSLSFNFHASGVVQLCGWQHAVSDNVLLAASAPEHHSTPPQPFVGLVGAHKQLQQDAARY